MSITEFDVQEEDEITLAREYVQELIQKNFTESNDDTTTDGKEVNKLRKEIRGCQSD